MEQYDRFLKNVDSTIHERSTVSTSALALNEPFENKENPEYFCALENATAFHVEYSITDTEGIIRKTALIEFENGRYRVKTSDDDLIFYQEWDLFYRYLETEWKDAGNILFDSQFFMNVILEIFYGFWTLDPYASFDVPWPDLTVQRTLIGNEYWNDTPVNVYEYTQYVPSTTGELKSLGDPSVVWVDAQTHQCLKAERLFRGELFRAVYSYPKDLSVPDPMVEP